jgi:SHS2 domain-containing protein
MDREAGFSEHEHTADWELEVWAPDIPTLFEQAAHGMYTLMGLSLETSQRISRTLEVSEFDRESLLVSFLSELLYFVEEEDLGFDNFDLEVDGESLRVEMIGAPIAYVEKEIKAVTFHNLNVRQTDSGVAVNIVFDV